MTIGYRDEVMYAFCACTPSGILEVVPGEPAPDQPRGTSYRMASWFAFPHRFETNCDVMRPEALVRTLVGTCVFPFLDREEPGTSQAVEEDIVVVQVLA